VVCVPLVGGPREEKRGMRVDTEDAVREKAGWDGSSMPQLVCVEPLG
jgi:hypothetical protein